MTTVPDVGLVTAKLRWIEKHEPENFSRIATVFGSYDYVNWRLTGERAVEQNWALEAGFTDLARQELSDDLIALAHIRREAVPRRLLKIVVAYGKHSWPRILSGFGELGKNRPAGVPAPRRFFL